MTLRRKGWVGMRKMRIAEKDKYGMRSTLVEEELRRKIRIRRG
jgi:hypothetical protein